MRRLEEDWRGEAKTLDLWVIELSSRERGAALEGVPGDHDRVREI